MSNRQYAAVCAPSCTLQVLTHLVFLSHGIYLSQSLTIFVVELNELYLLSSDTVFVALGQIEELRQEGKVNEMQLLDLTRSTLSLLTEDPKS
ncbi:hypothetical protein Hanom_Chr07g00580391 [Helianthus anomalus]